MQLVEPSEKYAKSFLEALAEYHAEGLLTNVEVSAENFGDYLKKIGDEARGINLVEGRVPQSIFWLVDGDKFIGNARIRHYLNEKLSEMGGHIGYDIRKSERGKGYGTKILELALPKAKEIGITRAMLTCDSTNIPSRRVIESNGGKLQDEVAGENGGPSKLRFWIDLK